MGWLGRFRQSRDFHQWQPFLYCASENHRFLGPDVFRAVSHILSAEPELWRQQRFPCQRQQLACQCSARRRWRWWWSPSQINASA